MAPVPRTPFFLLFFPFLTFPSTADHFDLDDWDDPNLTSTSPEDQRRQGLENNTDGKGDVESKRPPVANNEDRELKDFIARFYENLDVSYDAYDEEYDDTMDYSKTQDNHGSDVDLVTIIVEFFLLKKWVFVPTARTPPSPKLKRLRFILHFKLF